VCALYALTNSMMFTPCWPSAGPTGGAGVACPAGSCSVNVLTSFFFGGMVQLRLSWAGRSGSDLGNLVEVQLDRSLPAEDRDQDLELLLVGVDLADRRRERGERPVGDGDRVADLEVEHLDLGLLLGVLRHRGGEPLDDLVEGQRCRPVGPVGGADEPGHPRRVAHTG